MNKKKARVYAVAAIAVVLVTIPLIAWRVLRKTTPQQVKEILTEKTRITLGDSTEKIGNRVLVDKYYETYPYEDFWTRDDSTGAASRDTLISLLGYVDSLGLCKADYHVGYIHKYDSLAALEGFDFDEYRSESEVIFTDAALSLLFRAAYGSDVKLEHSSVKQVMDTAKIFTLFRSIFSSMPWRAVMDSLEPAMPQYKVLKQHNTRMQSFLATHALIDTAQVRDSIADAGVAITRLRFFGLVPDSVAYDSTALVWLKPAVRGFQKMVGLDTMGKLDKYTRDALNAPLRKRLAHVQQAMNYWRWMQRVPYNEYLLVNLAAAKVQAINRDSLSTFGMRMIVGKPATQTPVFTAFVYRVSTYPYWVVPISIATGEMLPKIKANVGYLQKNRLELLNYKNEIVDPATVKWSKYSKKYFPFTIRQTDGLDNALGIIKFDLSVPFAIYMHDTNERGLFTRKERHLSHGCMRLEKPLAMADYLLREKEDSTAITSLNKSIAEKVKESFPLKKRVPVLVLYMLADVDAYGGLYFYKDVYKTEEKPAVKAAPAAKTA